jgi:hypothetical protein
MLVPLTRGLYAVIDDEDYPLISHRKWVAQPSGKTFYAVNGLRQRMHRCILQAAAGAIVDHIDHDGLNNTRKNLRFATRTQNLANGTWSRRLSGYRGVYLIRSRGVYQASLRFNGKNISQGYYKTAEEAAAAYDRGAVKYFGNFATLNFPERRVLS